MIVNFRGLIAAGYRNIMTYVICKYNYKYKYNNNEGYIGGWGSSHPRLHIKHI